MPTVVCPSCQRSLRVPSRLAGRQLICPGCNDAVDVPAPEDEHPWAVGASFAQVPALASAGEVPLSHAARLGVVAMFLGTLSVLVLCLPYVGYAALGLSGVGLLIGLWGLLSAWLAGDGPGGGRPQHFGERGRDYPLAGIGMCLLALALVLLPFLFR
jgi:hypothetical protein